MEKKKLYKQIEFFASMKLFSSWSYNAIKNLYYLSTTIEFKKYNTVYKENDPPGDVYIIKSGEFKVIKNQEQEDEYQIKTGKSDVSLQRYLKKKLQKFDVCILGPGEAFGEEEVVKKTPRKNTVICYSLEGSVFVIDQKEFLKRIYLSQIAKKQLQEQIFSKSQWRDKRIENQVSNIKIKNPQINMNVIDGKTENNDNDLVETNEDPEEFAMIKTTSSRKEQDNLSNRKFEFVDPKKLIEDKKREKVKMTPMIENLITPSNIVSLLNGNSISRQLSMNSPIKNFFILNNLFLKEKKKKKKNQNDLNESNSKQKKIKNIKLEKKSENSNVTHSIKPSITDPNEYIIQVNQPSSKNNQITLPFSTKSINNYLKIRNNSIEDFRHINNLYTPQSVSRNKNMEKIDLKKKMNKTNNNSMNEELFIGGDISKRNFFNFRKSSLDITNKVNPFLPLKYSSEKIKRKDNPGAYHAVSASSQILRSELLDCILTSKRK